MAEIDSRIFVEIWKETNGTVNEKTTLGKKKVYNQPRPIRLHSTNMPQPKNLSRREQQLLDIVAKQKGRLTTKDIYDQAKMARATALKHLEVLEAEGFVSSEYLGSTKLWWLAEHCTKCGGIMRREYVSFCPTCTKELD